MARGSEKGRLYHAKFWWTSKSGRIIDLIFYVRARSNAAASRAARKVFDNTIQQSTVSHKDSVQMLVLNKDGRITSDIVFFV